MSSHFSFSYNIVTENKDGALYEKLKKSGLVFKKLFFVNKNHSLQ